ncbi:hypothetical protein HRJ35_14935 [Shewanella oneidensis MR-1]|uniref:Mu phage uncharacterized protein n=1 Tax=Shewanella oneidensis (strain ATCC 700550 / JCM 31522 / CIP 106686 / LMG 19005 / NCIMB 14063 / MR-1) TaxID=211586 RepID=Q8EDS0_SHEON|nr:hypothetical protein [Shewanella oneidensis]AAN55701.1 Mu phage uncharacterized protein [Shewanella oneidensis MR-1]MDX5995657.1 hypothetical protein [Shewanella oneidensis]MEE2026292.1 hypothetical protein [Shewanella oneidensis]QKG97176.1 hypothetical protein HRJ35_14935 [Shewanella oneidensis MR-1]
MSLPLIMAVAQMAMQVGPAAIRGISSLFGGSETAEKIAGMVEQVDDVIGLSSEQKEIALTRKMQTLSPESMVELERIKVEMEKEITRRQELTLNDKQAEQLQTQETIRGGDKAENPYIRITRPLMARQSMWAVMLYCFLMEALHAFGYGVGVDVSVAALLSSPAWAYLGLRTLDGFAPHPKSSGQKTIGALVSLGSNLIKRR